MARGRAAESPRKSRATSTRAAAPPAPERTEYLPAGPGAERAAWTLWAMLALTIAARAAFAFVPSMAGWSLDYVRFTAPWAGWPLLAVAAIALVPPLARRAAPGFARAGDFVATGGVPAVALVIAIVVAAVLALPDRAWYVGDFLLRQGAIEEAVGAARVFPQALPLDRLLHNSLPTWLEHGLGLGANTTGRLLGALDAALLAWAAIVMARTLAWRGGAALAAVAVIVGGGYLATFTGYSKAMVELCALTAAAMACALRLVRSGRGRWSFAVVSALAFLLHRSALALVPGVLATWILWWRRPDARAAARAPATWLAFALPWLALAVVLQHALHTFATVDLAVHLAPADVRARGPGVAGAIAAAFAGNRGLDLANLAMMMAPLLLPAFAAALTMGRLPGPAYELGLLLAFALPLILPVPFVHPVQGMVRDWDNFVASGASLTMLAAWCVGGVLMAARRGRWVAVPALVASVAIALQWLALHSDPDRGLTRMRAFLDEPPLRTEAERVAILDYLGIRAQRLSRFGEAAEAFHRASNLVPNPRFTMEWGVTATQAGDYASARDAYQRVLQRTPNDVLAWRGYTATSVRLGDREAARRGALEVLKRAPGDPDATALLAALGRADSAGAIAR